MKRIYLLISILILVGILFGELLVSDPGYVLVIKNGTSIETTANIAIILTIFLVGSGIILFLLLFNALGIGRAFGGWLFAFFYQNSLVLFEEGMTDFQKGHWKEAYKKLNRAANANFSVVAWTSAALAAEHLGKSAQADQLLERAADKYPSEKQVINLARAEVLTMRSEYSKSIPLLRNTLNGDPKNNKVMRMLVESYLQSRNPLAISNLLPQVKANKTYSDEELESLEEETWLAAFLQQPTAEEDPQSFLARIQNAWNSAPDRFKLREQVYLAYIRQLINLERNEAAARFITDKLKRRWDGKLVELYGKALTSNTSQQLQTARLWLSEHPDDVDLQVCLGRLSAANQTWLEAKQYFETALEQRVTPEVLDEYREVLGHAGLASEEQPRLARYSQTA